CVGTFVDPTMTGNAEWGRSTVGTGRPYLLYCGRYHVQKGVPQLLDFARRYQEDHPDRFTFAFIGQGDVAIPRTSWVRDLGFIDETSKRAVMAGSAALVHLSPNESLSLVALEAWIFGIPVIARADCAVLASHLRRCGGGQAVDNYETFRTVLNDLWDNSEQYQRLGGQGREYVRKRDGGQQEFGKSLGQTIQDLELPFQERMRLQGLHRAAVFAKLRVREFFARVIEEILDKPARPMRGELEIQPRTGTRTATVNEGTLLVPVRISNRGTHAVFAHG